MIRFAFLGVFLIGSLIAFGAFFLVRGDGTVAVDAPSVAFSPQVDAEVASLVLPETRLYFLQGLDLTEGSITLILRDPLTRQGDVFVRDQAVIAAAKDTAYVNAPSPSGGVLGMVDATITDVPAQDTAAQIYQNDALVAALVCSSGSCTNASQGRDIDLGPLLDAALPLSRQQSYLADYGDYLATVEAINQDTDYMFLDLRPTQPFPQERQTARMDLYLPTLVHPISANVDLDVASALVHSIITPLLPEGANIEAVTFQATGLGVVADMDSGTPTLAGGNQIPFPDVTFTNVLVSITGVATLSEDELESLTQQHVQQTDYAAAFAAFVRDRLQSGCKDCFMVKMNGDRYDEATITLSKPEGYSLDYYDLRDTP